MDREPAPSGWIGHSRRRARRGTESVTLPSPTAGLVAPVSVAEIELADPVSVTHISVADADPDCMRQALVLVRLNTQPVATIVVDAPGGVVDAESCAVAAWAALETAPVVSPRPAGLRPPPLATGKSRSIGSHCQLEATAARTAAPSVTVVVATRERTGLLAACLDSLARLDYPDYEVVIVDNDPVTDDTAKLIRDRAEPGIRYARENRRGLAAAHNCGLQLAEGTIVAFTDDDVIVDRHWLTEVAEGFTADTDVACVTGLILPAELQTPAQVLLEAHGNFSKGFRAACPGPGRLPSRRPSLPLYRWSARLGCQHVVRPGHTA